MKTESQVKSSKAMGKQNKTLPRTLDGRNALKYTLVQENISDILGKILTIIDATISPTIEPERSSAVKQLIKNAVYAKFDWLNELALKELEDEGSGHTPAQDWEKYLVPFDDEEVYSFK